MQKKFAWRCICCEAHADTDTTCRKYRPSVHSAATLAVTTAVPAEPVKRLMNWRRASQSGAYSLCNAHMQLCVGRQDLPSICEAAR